MNNFSFNEIVKNIKIASFITLISGILIIYIGKKYFLEDELFWFGCGLIISSIYFRFSCIIHQSRQNELDRLFIMDVIDKLDDEIDE